MATPVVGAQLQLALINRDENFKRRERRRAGGVDNGIPLGMAASGGVHSAAAIKRSMPVGLAADPPNAHQLKIP
jgi:hypothetical protein